MSEFDTADADNFDFSTLTEVQSSPSSVRRAEIVRRLAMKKRWVTQDGKKRHLATLEILMVQLKTAAMRGEPAACRIVDKLRGRLKDLNEKQPRGLLICGEELEEDEWPLLYNGEGGMPRDEFVRLMTPKWQEQERTYEEKKKPLKK